MAIWQPSWIAAQPIRQWLSPILRYGPCQAFKLLITLCEYLLKTKLVNWTKAISAG